MSRCCATCQKDISKRHPNAKRCEPCAAVLRKKPQHNLTKPQQKKALELAGKMFRKEIAKKIGCSQVAFTRFAATKKNVNWNAHKYDEKTINKIVSYYLEHTLEETKKKYPEISVRSIVDRYISSVKCFKWSDEEIVSLYRYTGLTSWANIANKLGRNRTAPKRKRSRVISGRVNGIIYNIAKHYVTSACPFYQVKIEDKAYGVWVTPWVDMEKHLSPGNPAWVDAAIKSLAKFQKWLHGSEEKIYRIMGGDL